MCCTSITMPVDRPTVWNTAYYLGREWVLSGHRVTIVGASHSHVRAHQPVMNGPFTSETVDGVQFVWCQTPRYQGNGAGRVNIACFFGVWVSGGGGWWTNPTW